jgi:ppGpp synthetase/RelA/SpoT-type nucleotidyltranferase
MIDRRIKIEKWYDVNRERYQRLTSLVQNTLENLLKAHNANFISVASRTKGLPSFLKKATSTKYKNPTEEIFDISASRIICPVNSDILKIVDLVNQSFKIIPEHTVDKGEDLGIDLLGYQSRHFVCEFTSERCALPEFADYSEIRFEIQVRTIIQHAWAEFNHDRNYKFSGLLPVPLRRRINILSGVLELVDREFNTLSDEIDRYRHEVSERTKEGDLDIEINSFSIRNYLSFFLDRMEILGIEDYDSTTLERAIDELTSMGVATLKGLNELLNSEFLDVYRKVKRQNYIIPYGAFLRNAMMFSDLERYFSKTSAGEDIAYLPDIAQALANKYGDETVRKVLDSYDIAYHLYPPFRSTKWG